MIEPFKISNAGSLRSFFSKFREDGGINHIRVTNPGIAIASWDTTHIYIYIYIYIYVCVYTTAPSIYVWDVHSQRGTNYKLVTHACTSVWPTGATESRLCACVPAVAAAQRSAAPWVLTRSVCTRIVSACVSVCV